MLNYAMDLPFYSTSKTSENYQLCDAEHICSVKLSEVYERLGMQEKLEGDITDPQTWEADGNQTKFVLGRFYF